IVSRRRHLSVLMQDVDHQPATARNGHATRTIGQVVLGHLQQLPFTDRLGGRADSPIIDLWPETSAKPNTAAGIGERSAPCDSGHGRVRETHRAEAPRRSASQISEGAFHAPYFVRRDGTAFNNSVACRRSGCSAPSVAAKAV